MSMSSGLGGKPYPYLVIRTHFASMRSLARFLLAAATLVAVSCGYPSTAVKYSPFMHPDVIIPYYRGSRQVQTATSELHATRGSPTQFRRLHSGNIVIEWCNFVGDNLEVFPFSCETLKFCILLYWFRVQGRRTAER